MSSRLPRRRCAVAQRSGPSVVDHGAAMAAEAAAAAAGTLAPTGACAVGDRHGTCAVSAHHCARAVCRRARGRCHHGPTAVGAMVTRRIRRFTGTPVATLRQVVVHSARLFCRARRRRCEGLIPGPSPWLPPPPPHDGALAGRVGGGGCLAGPASMHYSPRRPRVRCGQHRRPHGVGRLPGIMLPRAGRPATSAQKAPRRGTFRRARRRRLPATALRTAIRCFRRRRRRWLSSAHPTGTLSPSTPSSPAPRRPRRAWPASPRPPRRPMRCIGSVRLFRCGSAAAGRPPCRPHTCVSAAATVSAVAAPAAAVSVGRASPPSSTMASRASRRPLTCPRSSTVASSAARAWSSKRGRGRWAYLPGADLAPPPTFAGGCTPRQQRTTWRRGSCRPAAAWRTRRLNLLRRRCPAVPTAPSTVAPCARSSHGSRRPLAFGRGWWARCAATPGCVLQTWGGVRRVRCRRVDARRAGPPARVFLRVARAGGHPWRR